MLQQRLGRDIVNFCGWHDQAALSFSPSVIRRLDDPRDVADRMAFSVQLLDVHELIHLDHGPLLRQGSVPVYRIQPED